MSAEAAKLFRSAVEQAAQEGKLRSIDSSALAAWAQAADDYAQYTVQLRRDGEVIQLPNGTFQADPRCSLRAIAHRQVLAACRMLGFTPTDKSRVRAEKGPKGGKFASLSL